MTKEQTRGLNAAQKAALEEYRERWMRIGLSTDPTNRTTAENAIEVMYAEHDLPKPAVFWTMSPFECTADCAIKHNEFGRNIYDWTPLWYPFRNEFMNNLGHWVNGTVDSDAAHEIRRGLDSVLEAALVNRVGDHVYDHLYWNTDFSGLPSSGLPGVLPAPADDMMYGQFDSYWLARSQYLIEEMSVEIPKSAHLQAYWLLAQNTGTLYPFKNVCFVSEKMTSLHLDDMGRLHNPEGMAFEYADGWGGYFWNGVAVPDKVILSPSSLSGKDFAMASNVEVRRAMIEASEGQIFEQLELVELDAGETLEDGALYEFTIERGSTMKVLKVENSSIDIDGERKVYWLFPDQDANTVKEARRSISHIPGSVEQQMSCA